MNRLPGKFVWFEHLSPDVERARAFYAQWLGWKVEAMPMGDQSYQMILNAGTGIGGLRQAMAGVPTHWHAYLSVEDVDASAERARAAGAQVLMPPTDFGPVGRACTVADPTGAAFSFWRSTDGDAPDVKRAPVGAWCWTELTTTDDAKALAFYEAVVGYTHTTMPGSNPPYHMLSAGGEMRAGLMRAPQPGIASMWTPYVMTDGLDASVARAAAAGATTLVPPTAIPGNGRFAILADPLGAVVGAFEN